MARIGRPAGYLMSGLVIAFLLLDAVMKLAALDVVIEATAGLGFPASPALARGLGALLLLCVLLYAWPRSAIVGAILLTGYLGGAIAVQLRVGSPLFTHILFGAYIALLLWGGLFLRDPRVKALILLRARPRPEGLSPENPLGTSPARP